MPQPTPLTTPTPEPGPTAPVSRFSFLTNKNNRLVALIAGVAFIVLGGSAAAYYAVMVPNKPENILKTAVSKQLQKEQQASKGKLSLDFKEENAQIKNATIQFKAATDSSKNAFSAELEAAVSGIKLPLEARGIDNSLYMKVGDLGSIRGVAGLAGGEMASILVDGIGEKLSNQWIEIDESMLKQSGTGCTADIGSRFTKQDVDQLLNLYGESPFVSVTGKTKDKIDGKDVTKYDLGVDKQEARDFAASLQDFEPVKKLKDCIDQATEDGDSEPDSDTTTEIIEKTDISLAAWVDGGKNLRQLELTGSDDDMGVTILITFTDDSVDIQKPAGAKPITEVLGDFSQFFGSDPAGMLGSPSLPVDDAAGAIDPSSFTEACQQALITAYTSGATMSALPPECQ